MVRNSPHLSSFLTEKIYPADAIDKAAARFEVPGTPITYSRTDIPQSPNSAFSLPTGAQYLPRESVYQTERKDAMDHSPGEERPCGGRWYRTIPRASNPTTVIVKGVFRSRISRPRRVSDPNKVYSSTFITI